MALSSKNIKDLAKETEKLRKIDAARAAELQKVADAQSDISTAFQREVALNEQILAAKKNIFKNTTAVKDLEKEIASNLDKINTAKKLGLKLESNLLEIANGRLEKNKELLKALDIAKKKLSGLDKELQTQAAKLKTFVEGLPGGKVLSKILKLDMLGDALQESLSAAAMVLAKGGSLGQAAKAFGGTLYTALGPLGLIAIAAATLYAVFTGISKKAQAFSKETGITFSQARKLGKEASDMTISLDANLSKTKDIKDVLAASIKEFGVLNMLSAEQAMNVSEIGLAFGYGAEQAAKVNNTFMQMGASAESAADSQRDLAAEALKSGLNVGAVVKDIGDNAKLTSKYFGGNVKALKKAAIEAAKMGMSIATMAKVSDSLLSFEDSISSQFEFQALTGKQLNLDKARQLALDGKIGEATKLIMDQVGSSADLAAMNVIEREALAKATGMEFDQLQKSAIIKEKMKNLTADEAAKMANLGLSAAEMAGMSSKQLQDKLAEQQANERSEQAIAAMGNILINALMPAAQTIAELFGALAPIIKLAFFPITLAAKGLGLLVGLMKEYSGVTATVAGIFGAILINKKIQAALDLRRNAITASELIQLEMKAFFENNSVMKALSFQSIKSAILGLVTAENAQEKIGLGLKMRGIATSLKDAAANLGGAIAGIFKSFSGIPLGLGIPLAGLAVAGLYGLYKKATSVGDMGIDPNGGPIVTSPGLGGVFQGKKQDGLSMGPGMGTDPSTGASSTSGGGSINIDYQRMAQAIVKAMAGVTVQSAPIQIGAQVINAISDQIDVNKSYL